MLKITSRVSGNLDLDLPLKCPCGNPIKIQARDAAPGPRLTCSQCGATITLTGDDMRQAQEALDDLRRTLERFGR